MKPILLDLPMPIVTPRLLLRPPAPGDGKALNQALLESWDALSAEMTWAAEKPTIEQSEENVRRACAKWILREDLRITIHDPTTHEFLGSTGFHRIDWDVPSMEIGFWLKTAHVGKGIATESTAALTTYAFKALRARRVEIRCDAENRKSAAVAERLSFRLEARLKHDSIKADGSLRDTLIYVRHDLNGLPDIPIGWPETQS